MTPRALLALATASLVLAGCGGDEPRAAPRISPGAPEIFEHERAGHVPLQLIPGTWTEGERTLELGPVDEVVVDESEAGTYTATMEGRRFEARVPGCAPDMTWDFVDGDLVLAGGGSRCTLEGRWQRS